MVKANTSPQKVIGQPFIKTYTQKDYKAGRSNWCVIQDKRGVVYVGNENGIVEFDGSSWRKINVPNSESVRTMDIDENGTIFVCAAADFGYLESNSQGLLEYKSLLPYLDEKNRNFGEMWDVITSSHGVYYKNDDRVFRWKGDSIKVWDSIYAFRLYNINDKIYSRNQGTGLMVIDGDSIKLMPDGEFFNDTGVYNMLPFVEKNGKEKILITTNIDGLFLHDGEKNYPFKTEVDSYLSENQVYNACFTSDGNIALSTQRGGVIIVDKNGKLLRIINKNSGLPTDVVFDVWPDPMGGLWLATLNGIVFCEIPSSFSTLNKSGLLEDQANSILRFNGKLYITNELGIFSYSPEDAFFKLLNGSDLPGITLINANGTLLAATNGEVAVIKEDGSRERLMNMRMSYINQKYFQIEFMGEMMTAFQLF